MKHWLLLLFLGCTLASFSQQNQNSSSDTTQKKTFYEKLYSFFDLNKKFFFVPYVNYTPETRLAVGVSGFTFFRFNKVDTIVRPSSVRFNLAYTQLQQFILWAPYDLFLKENKYYLHGELGFYRYPYFFNGIGNQIPIGYEERYTASFPRIRFTAQRRLGKHIYFGPKIWFQELDMIATAEGQRLETGLIPGSSGGATSGAGFHFTYDTRKNIFFPSGSSLIQVEALYNQPGFGSDFTYDHYIFDFRKYIGIWKESHALALQAYADVNFGNVPFNQLAQVGGTNRMRGYRKGVYRDKKMAILQAEYRSRTFWRIGYTVFASSAWVGETFNELQLKYTIPAVGAGIRWELNRAENLRFRLDYAQGRGSNAIYVTVGEAF